MGGDLDIVKQFIRIAAEACHVELTTLIVPGMNDSRAEIEQIAEWVASIRKDIPLHVTRFFPAWKMLDVSPTPEALVYRNNFV